MAKAYELPAPGQGFDPKIFYLGALCKRGHDWGQGRTLRSKKNKNCILCGRIDALERQAKRRAADPEAFKAKQAAYVREKRAKFGRESRSKYGLPHGFLEANGFTNAQARTVVKFIDHGLTVEQIKERLIIDSFVKGAGQLPSVARLIYDQQINHWQRHPADRLNHLRQYAQWRHHWNYAMSLQYRLYHRSKSKQRKAELHGSHAVRLTGNQLLGRWYDFNHCCAYCLASGDLEVEHVVPISKGGEHHLGNIVPACHQCNMSKRSKDALTWYMAQPFYSEQQWHMIQSILNSSKPLTYQADLFAS